jgi:hypothetical protein
VRRYQNSDVNFFFSDNCSRKSTLWRSLWSRNMKALSSGGCFETENCVKNVVTRCAPNVAVQSSRQRQLPKARVGCVSCAPKKGMCMTSSFTLLHTSHEHTKNHWRTEVDVQREPVLSANHSLRSVVNITTKWTAGWCAKPMQCNATLLYQMEVRLEWHGQGWRDFLAVSTVKCFTCGKRKFGCYLAFLELSYIVIWPLYVHLIAHTRSRSLKWLLAAMMDKVMNINAIDECLLVFQPL